MFSEGLGEDEGFAAAADVAFDIGQTKTKTATAKLWTSLRTIRPDIPQRIPPDSPLLSIKLEIVDLAPLKS